MSKNISSKQEPKTTNRVKTSMSVGPESPNEIQGMGLSQASSDGFSPSYEDIQQRAYQLHTQRGGNDVENWLEAERILKEEGQKKNRLPR